MLRTPNFCLLHTLKHDHPFPISKIKIKIIVQCVWISCPQNKTNESNHLIKNSPPRVQAIKTEHKLQRYFRTILKYQLSIILYGRTACIVLNNKSISEKKIKNFKNQLLKTCFHRTFDLKSIKLFLKCSQIAPNALTFLYQEKVSKFTLSKTAWEYSTSSPKILLFLSSHHVIQLLLPPKIP